MNKIALLLGPTGPISSVIFRKFSVSSTKNKQLYCKLLVIGGGSGGCTMAAKFMKRKEPMKNVMVLEPSDSHYYQPLWTLVGAGVKRAEATRRDMKSVLPSGAAWLRDSAAAVDPVKCSVTTTQGDNIQYEHLIIAVGLVNDYDKIVNLREALSDPLSGVCTIYDPQHAEKTWAALQRFDGGDALFTYPDSPIKCPGAPQKIAYLADSYFRKKKVRSKSRISYNTCLPVIFGVPKYAEKLLEVVKKKGIEVNYRTVLKKLIPDNHEAHFVVKDKHDNVVKECIKSYDMIHVTPAMKTPAFLRTNPLLADSAGYLDVDMYTLQHKKYPNIYGLGDCTNTPNSKTAAAIAKQCYVVEMNMARTMSCEEPRAKYDGYGACPLVTSYTTCILAEFLYGGVVHETFPFDQSQESRLAYYMKRDLFPFIYWHFMLKGNYHGPEFIKKIVNPAKALKKEDIKLK